MSKSSGFFGAGSNGPIPPRQEFHGIAKPHAARGSYTYVASVQDPNTGQFVTRHVPIPLGYKEVLDFGAGTFGWMRFKPYDDSALVPMPINMVQRDALGRQLKDQKPDGEYVLCVRFPVLLQEFGLCQWTLAATIAGNAVLALCNAFEFAREAAAGQLPIYALRPSKEFPLASRNNEMQVRPVLELIGWMLRDEQIFGPRIVPPPLPLMPASPPARP